MPRSSPVDIVYYPKKERGAVPKRRQTIETVVTEIIEERPGRAAQLTLTDEGPDPAEQALAELIRIGHEAFEADRVDEARVVFESVVALGSSDPFPRTMLGIISLKAQALDQALTHFEAALDIDPGDLAALVYRGEIRLSRRKTSRAVEDLERAVKLGDRSDPFVLRAKKLLTLARANPTRAVRLS